jgi:hypothetical protein
MVSYYHLPAAAKKVLLEGMLFLLHLGMARSIPIPHIAGQEAMLLMSLLQIILQTTGYIPYSRLLRGHIYNAAYVPSTDQEAMLLI